MMSRSRTLSAVGIQLRSLVAEASEVSNLVRHPNEA